jgi:hypothetical protein
MIPIFLLFKGSPKLFISLLGISHEAQAFEKLKSTLKYLPVCLDIGVSLYNRQVEEYHRRFQASM